MGHKFGGWVALVILLVILLYVYDHYPEQRAILLFGAFFSALLSSCRCHGAK